MKNKTVNEKVYVIRCKNLKERQLVFNLLLSNGYKNYGDNGEFKDIRVVQEDKMFQTSTKNDSAIVAKPSITGLKFLKTFRL